VARGVIRIADANMVNALKLVSINRGYDPREYSLLAYGGGGAMHAVALAAELKFPQVIIPVNSAVFSAWGMLQTDLRRDYLRTHVVGLNADSQAVIQGVFDEMDRHARAQFELDGIDEERVHLQLHADLRYSGQEHTVKVQLPEGRLDAAKLAETRARFDEAHERSYTYKLPHEVQIVNFHVVGYALVDKPQIPKIPAARGAASSAITGRRQVDFDRHGRIDTPIYSRQALGAGAELVGPAILEEPAATTVVPPDMKVHMDDFGNVRIAVSTGSAS
jgi:N-methylhydantoinase A